MIAGAAGACALMAWAWWPSGQYQPVRPTDNGTVGGMVRMVYSPVTVARPAAQPAAHVQLTPGKHLALAMIPVGGATKGHPALFVIPGAKGQAPVAIVSYPTPPPGGASNPAPAAVRPLPAPPPRRPPPPQPPPAAAPVRPGSAPQERPPRPPRSPRSRSGSRNPGPNGTQALAVNTTNGGVKYDVAYSLVTVTNGEAVTKTNSAYALANCQGCTTVAVSFQIVLMVGQSHDIAPINAAGALNDDCPACITTAIADQSW